MVIRHADKTDAAAIVDLVAGIDRDSPYLLLGTRARDVAAEEVFLEAVSPEAAVYLLADAGSQLAGFAFALRGHHGPISHTAEVALGVSMKYRRQGIGRRLLAGVAAWAGPLGVRKITATVVAENLPGRALFEHAGFLPECIRREQIFFAGRYHDEIGFARFLTQDPRREGGFL